MSRAAFYVLFTVSGFAGLIYESIWTHYLKLFLGHAAYAQSLVLIVFMGGMALGAGLCGRLSQRLANPLLVYAAIEATVGVLAWVFHPVFVGVTDWGYGSLLPWLGNEWLALFGKLALCGLLILPQSILLGATFPLMSAGLVRAHPAAGGESVAMLYFTNSLGAAAGVLASGFWLIAWVGLPGTLRTAGGLNLLIAFTVWVLARSLQHAPVAGDSREERARLFLAIAFFTGLASFVYEIVWIRMLSLVLGASTHSFELMLATFIFGLALGGLAMRRRADAGSPERLLGWVQVAMALAAAATLPVYDLTFGLMESLMTGLARNNTGYLLFNLSGAAIAALVMLPATFCAGMTLPLLTGALLRRGLGEAAIGRVYAANTLGAIAGVVLAVHVGLPLAGLKFTLLAGCLVDAVLGVTLLSLFGSKKSTWKLAAASCAAAFIALGAFVQLDVHKMTAGVFRHGELETSRDAKILFARDGKTATVHLVQYTDAVSLRTNGKSDGSIVLDRDLTRGSDEITMVLTAALPLALNPDTRRAAVIGIGTGLTTHTLLQSLAIEHVDTVEIEAVMAEAARGFMPRNSGAFADPRGTLIIDDAKSFFSASGARYDLIISEPSNPWVSGVSSLFTREFYRRIRGHLEPGGLLVQWFQLYEIDPSLVASVMGALGEEFPHYAVFAPSDHDLLIVAGNRALPLPAQARIFEQPGVAKELWTVHVLSAGDLDARYIGGRALLEPMFASYGMPANSDYAPLLDLNAARHRFTERSATDLVGLLNLDLPVLEMLEPERSRRAVNPLFQGAYAFERIENARLAWYARDFLLAPNRPAPDRVPTQLQKDLDLLRVRLIECREPRDFDVWIHSALRVAALVNPHLAPNDAVAIWARAQASPCYASLRGLQRDWLTLLRAVAARDAGRMATIAEGLLGAEVSLATEAREYLLTAAMSARLAAHEPAEALRLWREHSARVRASLPPFRLLRCHAERASCAAEFADYAVR